MFGNKKRPFQTISLQMNRIYVTKNSKLNSQNRIDNIGFAFSIQILLMDDMSL